MRPEEWVYAYFTRRKDLHHGSGASFVTFTKVSGQPYLQQTKDKISGFVIFIIDLIFLILLLFFEPALSEPYLWTDIVAILICLIVIIPLVLKIPFAIREYQKNLAIAWRFFTLHTAPATNKMQSE